MMLAPERFTRRSAGTVATPKQGSAVADEVMEEVLSGLPCLAEEYMWIGQADEDGLPEMMDEEMEEATIQELLRQATAKGNRLNVS